MLPWMLPCWGWSQSQWHSRMDMNVQLQAFKVCWDFRVNCLPTGHMWIIKDTKCQHNFLNWKLPARGRKLLSISCKAQPSISLPSPPFVLLPSPTPMLVNLVSYTNMTFFKNLFQTGLNVEESFQLMMQQIQRIQPALLERTAPKNHGKPRKPGICVLL